MVLYFLVWDIYARRIHNKQHILLQEKTSRMNTRMTCKILGRFNINKFDEAILSRMNTCACTVIKIKEEDFTTETDEKTKMGTASWNRSGQVINHLMN